MGKAQKIDHTIETSLPYHLENAFDHLNIPFASIPEMIKEQAYKTPDAIALVYKKEQLTYQQLDYITDQFAQMLKSEEDSLETIVCILVEKSLRTIVSMIAVLKAGWCYLALEQDTPQQRLDYILEDTHPQKIITTNQYVSKFNKYKHGTYINLDLEWENIKRIKINRYSVNIKPQHLAYISYTSGTTGKPKGVCIPHASVIRLVKGNDSLSLNEQTIFLQLAPVAFDASTLEIWGTLANGGKLIIYTDDHISPEMINTLVKREQVNTLWLTAGLFHSLIDHNIELFDSVKHVISGGDVVSAKHVHQLFVRYPSIKFSNGYGPTENTTFTTIWTTHQDPGVERNLPIGYPISQTSVYILDSYLSIVSSGTIGDLYTSGVGLARGYLNHPYATAEKFIPNPFSNEPGARMYFTGDQAKWNEDGTIDFVGRTDHQIKINGYRIEPNEIETLLKEHIDIRDAVVIVQELDSQKKLIGYVTLHHSNKACSELAYSFKEYLKDKIPTYMLPWLISIIPHFPLTSNGKVDREALPKIDKRPRNITDEYIPARHKLDFYLVNLWQDMLKIDVVGIEDDFFELGGHSLILAQVVSQIRTDYEINIQSKLLYSNSTIQQLSDAIQTEYSIGGNNEIN